MIYEYNSYRSYLKSVLVERIQKNSAYSLRSMAKSIDVAPSQLSNVFQGKKNLSLQNSLRIAAKLELDSREQEYFSLLVQYELSKAPAVKQMIHERLASMNSMRTFHSLDLDALKIVSDWYHAPIIVLAESGNLKPQANILARKLGISQPEAEVAIERLIRVNILKLNSKGYLEATNSGTIYQSDIANKGLQDYHKSLLKKASEAISTQDNNEKFIGSETMMFDSKQLKKFRYIVEDFFSQSIKTAKSGKSKKEVYHLGVQFFRLTTKVQVS